MECDQKLKDQQKTVRSDTQTGRNDELVTICRRYYDLSNFSSTTGLHVFEWVLQLMIDTLLSKRMTRKIVSDDHPCLRCALEVSTNADIRRPGREINFRRELDKFVMSVNKCGKSAEEKSMLIRKFRRIGFSREEKDCDVCLAFVTHNDGSAIRAFMENSVLPVAR
jgi:hypothetical protein